MASGKTRVCGNGERIRVLLVGNYKNDRQESMQRFRQTLERELPRESVSVEFLRPESYFGRLIVGGDGIAKWLGYIDKFLIFPFVLRRRALRVDVVHICDHSNAVYTRWLQKIPHLVTCHDLLAVRSAHREFPQNSTNFTGRILQRLILSGLRQAQQITCVSAATRQDVLRLTARPPSDVTVTCNGQNYSYSPMPLSEAASEVARLLAIASATRKPQLPSGVCESGLDIPRFLLHVGGGQWYKNRTGVLLIYAFAYAKLSALGFNVPMLVMVGPELQPGQKALLQEAGIADEVRVLSSVTNEALRALYSMAELLLFPSIAEGFGWPILEAQACGCPVVTTGQAPMTEIGGAAAAYISPRHVTAGETEPAAEIVLKVLHETRQERDARRIAGFAQAARFTTGKMVQEYLAIYNHLAGTRQSPVF